MNNDEYNDRRNRLFDRLDDAEARSDINHVYEIQELIRELDAEYLRGNDNEIR